MDKNEIRFKGKKSPLSNLFILSEGLRYKDTFFNSSEQAYQWEKSLFHGEIDLARQIIHEQNPYMQMRLGHIIKENQNWTNKKQTL